MKRPDDSDGLMKQAADVLQDEWRTEMKRFGMIVGACFVALLLLIAGVFLFDFVQRP